MKNLIFLFIIFFFASCGGGGSGSSSSSTSYTRVDPITSADKTILLSDEFSQYQWHRTKLSLDTLNLTYLGYNSADPIIIQVVDDGIEADHEDLYNNMSFSSSYNVEDGTNDPTPDDGDTHGTNVAGIIGAVGYNNIGLKGIAPSSNLAGFALDVDSSGYFTYSISDLTRAWFSGDNANNIAVSNNSWGSCVSKDEDEELILENGATSLRDGKGRIYIFSGGNGREGDSDCPSPRNEASSNTTYLTNSQYSIAVAAVGRDDVYSYYSSPGANILVSGYSSNYTDGIGTTVPEGTSTSTWSDDINYNYTDFFSGTSASAPIVSGSIALVLEACPSLTYRDIKYLIAKNATKIDTSNTTWILNTAGLSHSNDYGFGVINPTAMISECTSSYTSLGTKQTLTVSDTSTSTISSTLLEKTLNIATDITIEWVGLTITTDYSRPGNLEIKLISPSGTESELLHYDNQMGRNSSYFSSGFRLSSQAFMSESSNGNWTVEITSNNTTVTGSLTELSLEIVGH